MTFHGIPEVQKHLCFKVLLRGLSIQENHPKGLINDPFHPKVSESPGF